MSANPDSCCSSDPCCCGDTAAEAYSLSFNGPFSGSVFCDELPDCCNEIGQLPDTVLDRQPGEGCSYLTPNELRACDCSGGFMTPSSASMSLECYESAEGPKVRATVSWPGGTGCDMTWENEDFRCQESNTLEPLFGCCNPPTLTVAPA